MKKIIFITLLLFPLTVGAAQLAPGQKGAVPLKEPLQPVPVNVTPNYEESIDRKADEADVATEDAVAGQVPVSVDKGCLGSVSGQRCVDEGDLSTRANTYFWFSIVAAGIIFMLLVIFIYRIKKR